MTKPCAARAIAFAAALAAPLAPLADPPAHAAGFPNTSQTPGQLLSGLNAPQQGRTAVIAWQDGFLVTSPETPSSQPNSDLQVRVWDIANPRSPVVTHVVGSTPNGINAHGYYYRDQRLVLGGTSWALSISPLGVATRNTNGLPAYTRGNLYYPFYANTWWTYGAVSDPADFGRYSVGHTYTSYVKWSHLADTGVIGHPFIIGNILFYAADQSRTGVAAYDMSLYLDGDPNNNPAKPPLLDVLTDGAPGGYWPEIWGGNGKLYLVFPDRDHGNGFNVVDATDPADLKFVADKRLAGAAAMYCQFQDEYAFIGDHKIDMRTLESVLFLDGANATRTSDGGRGIDTSQFALPVGNLLVTGGIGGNQGMAIWAHQATPDHRGPFVGFHIPHAGQTNYPVAAPITVLIHETLDNRTLTSQNFVVRPVGGQPVAGSMTYAFNDTLTFVPSQPLASNTTYEVLLPEGGIKDAAGNGMQGYSFTFSTGSSVNGNRPPVVQTLTSSQYPVAPGGSTQLAATSTDPDNDALEFRFDFGDGSPQTAWSSSAAATHTYATQGHFRATVQARDPAGSVASKTISVTVLTPPAGPRPTQSGPLALAPSRLLWVANPDADTVAAVSADSLAKQFEAATGKDPRSVAVAADGSIWVACHDADRIDVLSGSNGQLLTSIPTGHGSAPAAVAMTPDGASAFVTLGGTGLLKRYSTATRAETGSLPLGPTPRAIAVAGNGARVLVTRFISDGNYGQVWDVASGAGLTLTRTYRLVRDRTPDSTGNGRGVPNYLSGIAISPDGEYAWITAKKDNDQRGTYFVEALDSDNTVRAVVVRLKLSASEEQNVSWDSFLDRIDVDNSDSPSAVAFSPMGDYAFVALQGNNAVAVFDDLEVRRSERLGGLVAKPATGAAPQGVLVDPVTRRVFVQDFLGRTVTALNADAFFRTGDQTFNPVAINTVANEKLAAGVLAGKRVFYHAGDARMSAEGYISCASCHLDGGHDGRTWDFTQRGEGLRNTVDLRGKSGMGHGNVHWTANFDEIQDFENDIRLEFGGEGFLSASDWAATSAPLGAPKAGRSPELDALAAYVASLDEAFVPRSPHRAADGGHSPEAIAGKAVFLAQGCATCHGGDAFTDAATHDVGTLRTSSGRRLGATLAGIETPTLRGAFATPPYFHDGSAPTLADVFRYAGGVVYQAESGSVSGGATRKTGATDIRVNEHNSVHGAGMVSFGSTAGTWTLASVDGGSGGVGAVEFRYLATFTGNVAVTVNGVAHNLPVQNGLNLPTWKGSPHWQSARIEGVALAAGASNTIAVQRTGSGFSIDDVTVSTANHFEAAHPHRRVLAIAQADRDNLLAYVREIDGATPDADPPPPPPPASIRLEAEAFTAKAPGSGRIAKHQWYASLGPDGFSGSSAMRALPNSGLNTKNSLVGPRLDYLVQFPEAGEWYVWVRLAGGASDDSVQVGLNGSAVSVGGEGVVRAGAGWGWVGVLNNTATRLKVAVPSPGPHTINVWMREDGVSLDQIAVSRDPAFTP